MRFARIALLLALFACGASETPYVILRIEDPDGLGASATTLVITDASGNSTQLPPATTGFPMTVTLTSQRKGPQSITIDLYAGATMVARGTATIDFTVLAEKTVALVLQPPCATPDKCNIPPPACSQNAECDDGLYCNGLETCQVGACVSGTPPALAFPGTTCSPTLCSESYKIDVTVAPDNTPCDPGDNTQGSCYGGQCVTTPPPSCYELINPAGIFGTGQQFGGVNHDISINELHFPESDADGYTPSWLVMDSSGDLGRTRDIGPLPTTPADRNFTIYVQAPMRMESLRVRSDAGTPCRLTMAPPTQTTVLVQSSQWATIFVDNQTLETGAEQKVRFTIACESGTVSTLRIIDFCLAQRGPL